MTAIDVFKALIFCDNTIDIDNDYYYLKCANIIANRFAQDGDEMQQQFKTFLLTTLPIYLHKTGANVSVNELLLVVEKGGHIGDADGVEKQLFVDTFKALKDDIEKVLNTLKNGDDFNDVKDVYDKHGINIDIAKIVARDIVIRS